MDLESRSKSKQKGIKRLIKSFKYAFEGLKYAFKHEQNLIVHIIATTLVIIAAIYFKLNFTEWLIVILIIGLVIATELINTSIEATIDLVTEKQHPLAKVAKDTAAAAVMVFAFIAIILGIMIFIPKILSLF